MRLFTGKATSTKMDKTVVVEVTRQWMHPKYKKTVKRTKKYLVHDVKSQANIGDIVTFTESKPISKRKRFKLMEVTQTNTTPAQREVTVTKPEIKKDKTVNKK